MSTGSGRDGKPLHLCAWCKEQLGWLRPAVLDPRVPQKLRLEPVEGASDQCFKVLVKPDGSEYLLLENRVATRFDRDLPAEGLLIWRVVNGRPQLEEAQGATEHGAARFLGAVPYPSPVRDSYRQNPGPGGGGWAVHITQIRRLRDGGVIFHIGEET
jgi:hypothetical protein